MTATPVSLSLSSSGFPPRLLPSARSSVRERGLEIAPLNGVVSPSRALDTYTQVAKSRTMKCHVSSAALPRKLTGSTSIYDGVFSGSSRGAQTSSGVEDYAEVFGGGENARRETIPVLDIPCFREGRARVDVRTSALDYSAVFGWGAGGFVASSYEEVVGDAAKEGRRVKAKKRSSSQLSNIGSEEGHLVYESSTTSSEAKRFNVSYSKSNVGSNGKPNGAVHIAQLADVPAYSILIEESGRLNQEKVDMQPVGGGEAGKHSGVGMVEGIDCKSASFSVSAENSTEQSSRKVVSGHRSNKDGSFSGELLFDRCGFMVGKDSYGQNPPSNLYSALPGKKGEMNGRLSPRRVSEGVDGAYSLPDLGSELDANSAAAATVAAVKIAIEKAQARIKAAKAIMEGRKVFEFKVSVKKKFGREHEKGDMKAKKEDLTAKVLHQKVHDEDTRVCSLGGILQPNISKVHAVNGERIDTVKVPLSNESIVAGPREKCSEIGVNCWKGEVENREQEEDLFEDARAEPHHPVRDEQREAIGVKKEKQPSDMLVSNFNRSASRTSAMVVNFEPALDEGLCQEKAKPELLIFREANESKEQIVPFEFAEKMTAKKENAPAIHTVSDDLMSIKNFAFHFHMTPFEKLPMLRIPEPEVKLDFQLLVGQNFFDCAAEVNADDEEERENGDDFSNEHDDEMRGDLVMEIGNCKFGKEQEQRRDVVNRGMQLEEHGLEYNIGSLGVERETGVTEIYGPAIPKEWNDVLAGENDGGCQEEREFWESPNCKEADLSETILPGGYHTEDLEIHPETCDVIKAEKVPTDVKPTRRCWTVEDHDVRRLINAVAANACEPNAHKQLIGTQGSDGQNQDQTADEVTDDVDKEDGDKIILKNASAVLGDMECVSTEIPSDSVIEENCSDEPADLVCNTFRNEKNLEDYASEAFIYRGAAAANLDNASVDSDLTCDEVSERSSSDEALVQGTFFKSEDIKLNESDVSQCSGQESEASVEEAKSETEAEVSGDDFNYEVIAEGRQLDDGLVVKEKGQTVEERTDTEKNGENHHTKLMTEEVEAKGSLRSEMQVEEASGKNVDEDKGKERAREKERKAVERAIREARERAYIEARERAGRAAEEKATAEARQRGIAQAREKIGMSSLEPSNKADDKKLMKAKLIAERAAVERATAEARERALEKALAEKQAAGDEDHKARKKSNHRCSGSSSTSKCPSTSDPSTHCAERSEEDDGESAQRWKARFERHQRTAERAAKALAEKNKRDLLAQKEQAERSRLAETLDADIKRWSSGKQGNLRALLSTLQYILGPDSGWQPVTLMEILTAPAVKKAYRKATLYVHPDKLQQRGASLQQKYVCEKVFDLLKDAWNKFSAEER